MFNVELSVDSFGSHAVVALYGELRMADAPGLASHLITAVAACGPSIIVDLAGLELIDPRGLGVLVRVLEWTRESGGDMALAALQPQIRQVLSVTGVIDDFSVYPSVELAESGTRLAPPGVGGHVTAVQGVMATQGHAADLPCLPGRSAHVRRSRGAESRPAAMSRRWPPGRCSRAG